jgi:hypothetical protein
LPCSKYLRLKNCGRLFFYDMERTMVVLIKRGQSYLFKYSKSKFQTILNFKLLHYVYYMHLHYFFEICEMLVHLDQMCLEKSLLRVNIIFHLGLFHPKLGNNFMEYNKLKEDLDFCDPLISLITNNSFSLNFEICHLFNLIFNFMMQFDQG